MLNSDQCAAILLGALLPRTKAMLEMMAAVSKALVILSNEWYTCERLDPSSLRCSVPSIQTL